TVDDDLVVIADAHRDRRAPSDRRLPRGSPDLLSCLGGECGDESARVLILVEDDPILVEQRRAGRPMIIGDAPEVALPEQLAVEIEGQQAAAAERDVDTLAVSCRRRRRVTVLIVSRI